MPATVADLRSVLRILQGEGAQSRRALAHRLEMAPGTVVAALEELTECGLVREAPTHRSGGGRPLKRWAVAPEARTTLGVTFTEQTLTLVAVDFAGVILCARDVPTPRPATPVPVIRALSAAVESMWDDLGVTPPRRLGVGIALPGVYAEGRGVLFLPNLPGWVGSDPKGMLETALDLPVAMENDANAAAYAEGLLGAVRGVDTYAYCMVADGTGGAVVTGGRTVRGAIGAGGEFGHLRVRSERACNCGLVGCLETEASGLALRRMLAAGVPPDEAVDHMAGVLGDALANVVNCLAPEAVVLGGWVIERHPELVFAVANSARAHTLPILVTHVRWLLGTVGAKAPAVGAALMLMRSDAPVVYAKGGGNAAAPVPL